MANTDEETVEHWCRFHHGPGEVIVEWRDGGVNFRCAPCGSFLRCTGTMAHPTTPDEAVEILTTPFGEMATFYARQAWPELFSST